MIKFFTFHKLPVRIGFILLFAVILSCKKESVVKMIPIDQKIYVLSDNNLILFNSKSVKTQLSKITITGLAAGESLLNIDFRPATGELYGVSNASKLYIIDVNSAVAKVISTTAFTPLLNGNLVNIDFNPSTDQLRIVTNTGQNLRVNPETGTVIATDANVNSTAISGIAHYNNYAGTNSTLLYDIDLTAKKLLKQESNGTLTAVGNLNLDLGTNVSFDISDANIDNKHAFAVGKTSEGTNLFSIDLSTGNATFLGKFLISSIQGIAMPANPVAYATDHTNNLIIFDPTGIVKGLAIKPITGLQPGETIQGMDMRPANGQIYAIGSSSRLYTINIGTGAVTQVGTGTLSTLVAGNGLGFDFNPTTDLIRVVSDAGQNFRINPTTAAITVDPNITPPLTAAAFSNNYRASTTTVLYVLETVADKLYVQEPNTGVLTAVADLKTASGKLEIAAANGFDILSTTSTNLACGIFTVAGVSNFYTIELSSGLATRYSPTFTNNITAFTLGLRF